MSHRVGWNALTFIHTGREILHGSLRDISDTGARLEINDMNGHQFRAFSVAIPLLHNKEISCEVSWSRGSNGYKGSCFGVRFVGLTLYDRNHLRKSFLLDETLLLAYAADLIRKADDADIREEIKSFFIIDVKRSLERLIDIETMIEAGAHDAEILREIKETLDTSLDCSHKLELMLNNAVLSREIKQKTRMILGHFLYQSNILKRAFVKPRGFPGDYKIIEIAYNNRAVSEGLGRFIDLYGMQLPYTVAIRFRKDKMREILYNFINRSTEASLNILNLASGACREIREMFALPITYRGYVNLMCIDQDEQAIEYARDKFAGIYTGNISVNLMQGNILKLESLDIGDDNGLDLIYSIGIADYLQDRMLDKLFRDCYRKLKTGGQFVVAYKDRERNKPLCFHWYADWNFIPRNEREFICLIQNAMGADNISIEVEWEKSGIIFFAIVTKLK